MIQAGGWKRPWGPDGGQVEQESAVFLCSKEGQLHVGLCEQDCSQLSREVISSFYLAVMRPHLEFVAGNVPFGAHSTRKTLTY